MSAKPVISKQIKLPMRVPRKPAAAKVPRPPKPSAVPKKAAKSTSPLPPPPKKEVSYWRKCRWFVLGFVAAVAVFGACAWLVRRQVLVGKDLQLFRFVNDWPERLRTGFVALTALGSFWAAAALVATAFVLRLYQLAWRLALSIFTAYGLLLLLKEFFARPRPEALLGDIHVRAVEASLAFPSAHAATATVLALTLRTYIPLPAVWQWLIVLVWIASVGLSRVYLGVHTPLDVVAGIAVGAGVVCFWRILPRPLKKVLRLK